MTYEPFIRQAVAVAQAARDAGSHPFGALLLGPDGTVLLQAGNESGVAGDRTAHAERVLMTRASLAYDAAFLATCTMVASAEPCAMCAGAAYWAGIGRVVFGMPERELRELIGPNPDNLTLDLSCRVVFAAGQRPVEVIGPVIPEECRAVHDGFWR